MAIFAKMGNRVDRFVHAVSFYHQTGLTTKQSIQAAINAPGIVPKKKSYEGNKLTPPVTTTLTQILRRTLQEL